MDINAANTILAQPTLKSYFSGISAISRSSTFQLRDTSKKSKLSVDESDIENEILVSTIE